MTILRLCEAIGCLEKWEKVHGNDLKAAMGRNRDLFHPAKIRNLTRETFTEFLSFKDNQHWHGIQRHQTKICRDMEQLQKSLAFLVDEKRKVECRLDELALKNSPYHITGLREAVLTAILMCAYHNDDKYAVYNSISTAALKRLEDSIGPCHLDGSLSLGTRYSRLNEKCHELKRLTGKPLWLIDVMFALIVGGKCDSAT